MYSGNIVGKDGHCDRKKVLSEEINYMGDNLRLFSDKPCVTIHKEPSVLYGSKKISCDIDGMIEFITNDKKERRFLQNGACCDKIKISIVKKGGDIYLTDDGTLAEYLKKYGNVGVRGYKSVLKSVSSDYGLILEGEVLLSQTSECDFIDCYRNMNNVIAKVKLLTGTI